MGANPAYVYETTEPDQDFDIMKTYAEPSKPVTSKLSTKSQNSVLIDASVLIPLDASFSLIDAAGTSFFC